MVHSNNKHLKKMFLCSMLQLITFVFRYATEVDVDFVRKSVRAIGRCAIKVEAAAERCVSTLLDLIQTKVNYVVQEAIVVIKVSCCHRFNLLFQTMNESKKWLHILFLSAVINLMFHA